MFGGFTNGTQDHTPSGGIRSFTISGISRDANGNPLPGCVVTLFLTGTDRVAGRVISDSTGYYAFHVNDTTTTYYATSYLVGNPDVCGMTVNTLTGS